MGDRFPIKRVATWIHWPPVASLLVGIASVSCGLGLNGLADDGDSGGSPSAVAPEGNPFGRIGDSDSGAGSGSAGRTDGATGTTEGGAGGGSSGGPHPSGASSSGGSAGYVDGGAASGSSSSSSSDGGTSSVVTGGSSSGSSSGFGSGGPAGSSSGFIGGSSGGSGGFSVGPCPPGLLDKMTTCAPSSPTCLKGCGPALNASTSLGAKPCSCDLSMGVYSCASCTYPMPLPPCYAMPASPVMCPPHATNGMPCPVACDPTNPSATPVCMLPGNAPGKASACQCIVPTANSGPVWTCATLW
jgi:hypothetical protein